MIQLLLGLVLLFSSVSMVSAEQQDHHECRVTPDIHEETSSKDELPTFLDEQKPRIKELYKQAVHYQHLLTYIPCYCGCGETANHKDNYDCFVYEIKDNGAVVWDNHATKCGLCLDIADESMKMLNEGQTVKDIRHYIDQKYKRFAKPTPTPIPRNEKKEE
ncbi:PCYCGC domain-containing protein [Bacillus sp. CGMCC 1.16541]|uniref:PCYCGC domain-containing protein n=1 Tax=Bacillus sp. CGMCC 1.16541 TaxID=2185143 RepID=UPI001EF3E039|nr:PCYCGC domain-containing protein [Bacillus sp. CGMCC 1.16541]